MIASVRKDTDAWISLRLVDAFGFPVTGLTESDVTLSWLRPNGDALESLPLLAWVEEGGGYRLHIDKSRTDRVGLGLVRAKSSTSVPSFVTVLVHDATAHGLPLYASQWIPVVLRDAGVPLGGVVVADITTKEWIVEGSALVPSSGFRELLLGLASVGVYQIRLDRTFFEIAGMATLHLSSSTFDDFWLDVPIAIAPQYGMEFRVTGGGPLEVELAITRADETEVLATVSTDLVGSAEVLLEEGDYRVTMRSGARIFDENNVSFRVLPWDKYTEATAPLLLAGTPGPYTLGGETLAVQVNGGETQHVDLEGLAAPLSDSSVYAADLAAWLNTRLHSVRASAGGLNRQYLQLEGLVKLDTASLLVGGAGNSLFNFPTTTAFGTSFRSRVSHVYLSNEGRTLVDPPDDSLHVYAYLRVLDVEGRPVEGVVVQFVPHRPALLPETGDAVWTRRATEAITDANGILRAKKPKGSRPRLRKGVKVDVHIPDAGWSRLGITVPETDFSLMDLADSANDLFTLAYPRFPSLPRS